jgi:hypothetical protein
MTKLKKNNGKKKYESIWVNSLITRSWVHDYNRPIERKVKEKKNTKINSKRKIMLKDEILKKISISKKNKTRPKSTCANL